MKKTATLLILTCALISFQGAKKNTATVFNLKALEKSLKFVPAGSFTAVNDSNSLPGTVHSFKAFYMYKYEVSNREYLTFLSELKVNDEALYTAMLPDTTVWRNKLYYCEPYVEYYFRHPAYRDYPVVGITHKQAEEYCRWLTERYKKEEKRKFTKAEFRLPTSYEWEYAARGGLNLSPFPWGGPNLQNEKGQWLANFHVVSQGSIAKTVFPVKKPDGSTADKTLLVVNSGGEHGVSSSALFNLLTPVLSYYPNGYGLYNMAGNVEEFVQEPGITHGGSFLDTGYYLLNDVTEEYDTANSASLERGFRFVMVVQE